MVSCLVFVTVVANLCLAASLAAQHRPSMMQGEVETTDGAMSTAGIVSVPMDRSLISRCSLQQHAAAEMAVLRSGLDFSAESLLCSSSMDVGVKGLSYVRFLKGLPRGEPRQTVWVTGFPRSSTSTVLSLVSAGQPVDDDVDGGPSTFSLFEPCHDGDEYVENMTCADTILQLIRCNFTGVKSLWGWTNSHTTSSQNGSQVNYSIDGASALCASADIVAFKTVDNHPSPFFYLLDEAPELRRIDVVRDPRGIYASWKTTEPFRSLLETMPNISGICDTFLENSKVNHDRLYRLVFENLVQDPETTMRDVYSFLGLEFGERQQTWLQATLNTTWCPEPEPTEVGYTDCHTSADDAPERWRSALSEEEIASFRETPSCQQITDMYGFVA
eukprot:TRINITY_DN759_c0_g1_i1.p1 TRINITY_DN759_c0_g1~~TRINITY_DN759_c0_g1_i1.p1  ORF type:complete len:387 (-),score=41.58 TRINITY_DN759_c0_g1_i1:16-1176(-)